MIYEPFFHRCAINCENRSLSTVCNAIDGFIQSLPGKNADVLSLCEVRTYIHICCSDYCTVGPVLEALTFCSKHYVR